MPTLLELDESRKINPQRRIPSWVSILISLQLAWFLGFFGLFLGTYGVLLAALSPITVFFMQKSQALFFLQIAMLIGHTGVMGFSILLTFLGAAWSALPSTPGTTISLILINVLVFSPVFIISILVLRKLNKLNQK